MNALRKLFIPLLVMSLGALSAVTITACADEEREEVEVSLTDRDLRPGRVEVVDGELEFVVKNDGRRPHTFAVETPDGVERTKELDPGEEERLEVTLPDGRYRMYDPRGNYRALGVRGTVVVGEDDTATVTEETVTERTVEEEEPDVEEPPVTVTERDPQPAPRAPSPQPQPQPAPTPPPTVTERVPVEPPPENP